MYQGYFYLELFCVQNAVLLGTNEEKGKSYKDKRTAVAPKGVVNPLLFSSLPSSALLMCSE